MLGSAISMIAKIRAVILTALLNVRRIRHRSAVSLREPRGMGKGWKVTLDRRIRPSSY